MLAKHVLYQLSYAPTVWVTECPQISQNSLTLCSEPEMVRFAYARVRPFFRNVRPIHCRSSVKIIDLDSLESSSRDPAP